MTGSSIIQFGFDFITKNNKKKIYKTVKLLLYIAPICILTNKIHTSVFDKYDNYKFDNIKGFFQNQDGIYWVLIFGVIYCIVYCLEKSILPVLVVSFVKPLPKSITQKIENRISNNEYVKESKKIPKKILNIEDFYSSILSIPICVTTWLLCLNSLFSYLLIIIIWIITYLYFRINIGFEKTS